jgi:hypothetical protein
VEDVADVQPGLAAIHFGESMCPVGDQNCVQAVARAFEEAIERRFGVLNSMPRNNSAPERYEITSASGQRIGELRYVDGISSLCFDAAQGQRCAVVGDGSESVTTALNTLQLLGLSYRQVQ